MFDSDQLQYQFIASRNSPSSSSLPIIPLNFPPLFDPIPYSSSSIIHHQESSNKKNLDGNKHVQNHLISTSLVLETEGSMDSSWSNDEVLALLKVRSSLEIWFPDFTWEHISRKLGELGFKKSPQECKERFEEESRSFNNVSSDKHYKNNTNIFSELDELYPPERDTRNIEKQNETDRLENPSQESDQEEVVKKLQQKSSSKKRKRSSKHKFEMFKGFCEAFVNKMVAQQEDMHNKMIEDIVKRDEAKIAREESWKNQEMDRIKKEIEIRAEEQENAAKKQSKIIEFLKKFTSQEDQNLVNYKIPSNSCTSDCNNNSNTLDQVPPHQKNPSPNEMTIISPPLSSPPSPSTTTNLEMIKTSISSKTHLDLGKRWPRDEVLALINLRCKMSNYNNNKNNNGGHDHENNKDVIKGPLWERISQGMLELGYNRSAKRCKEKWENINKYFRKTKDSNKKRSTDSRTCPYFHQLSSLYSEGSAQINDQ